MTLWLTSLDKLGKYIFQIVKAPKWPLNVQACCSSEQPVRSQTDHRLATPLRGCLILHIKHFLIMIAQGFHTTRVSYLLDVPRRQLLQALNVPGPCSSQKTSNPPNPLFYTTAVIGHRCGLLTSHLLLIFSNWFSCSSLGDKISFSTIFIMYPPCIALQGCPSHFNSQNSTPGGFQAAATGCQACS